MTTNAKTYPMPWAKVWQSEFDQITLGELRTRMEVLYKYMDPLHISLTNSFIVEMTKVAQVEPGMFRFDIRITRTTLTISTFRLKQSYHNFTLHYPA